MQVYFERLQLSSLAVSFESLLPEPLDRSSTRPYSSSISPIDGVRAPPSSCSSALTASVPEAWCFGTLSLPRALVGGGLGWVLGGFPRSVDRWVCNEKSSCQLWGLCIVWTYLRGGCVETW